MDRIVYLLEASSNESIISRGYHPKTSFLLYTDSIADLCSGLGLSSGLSNRWRAYERQRSWSSVSDDECEKRTAVLLYVRRCRTCLNFSHSTNSLPVITPMSSTPFRWGSVMGQAFCEDTQTAYEAQSLWRKNTFSPPSGHAGIEFVKGHTRFLRAYKDRNPMERVALKAIRIICQACYCRNHMPNRAPKSSVNILHGVSLWKQATSKSCSRKLVLFNLDFQYSIGSEAWQHRS